MYDIIFDLDGTLWDATDVAAQAYCDHFRVHSNPDFYITGDTLKGLFGKTMQEIGKRVLPEETSERQLELLEGCFERQHVLLKENVPDLYPQVRETLLKLKELGCRMFVVSNSQAEYIELFIEIEHLEGFFEGHLCFGDTNMPKAYNIRKIIQDYEINNPIYVGDTLGDYEASQEACVPFIYASYGYGKTENSMYQIDEFSQILDIVKLN